MSKPKIDWKTAIVSLRFGCCQTPMSKPKIDAKTMTVSLRFWCCENEC
jgi:hypothetical protein